MLADYLLGTLSVSNPQAMVLALKDLRVNSVSELVALSSLQRTQIERGLRDAGIMQSDRPVSVHPRTRIHARAFTHTHSRTRIHAHAFTHTHGSTTIMTFAHTQTHTDRQTHTHTPLRSIHQ